MKNIAISCKNLSKKIDNSYLFNNMTIDIPIGKIVGISGVSGSGKTSLLHILGLLDNDYNGSLHVLGQNMSQYSYDAYLRRAIAFIYQDNYLLNDLSIYDNIVLFYKIHGMKYDIQAVQEVIKFLQIDLNKNIMYLSGGERQRINIARAIVQRPKILFADELTSNLHDDLINQIMQYFIYLRDDLNMTIVFVSHNKRVLEFSDIQINMYDYQAK
ncbi:MAG: ATP-binding cassette domain-containing protein [Pseudomonadota bacterium]